MAARDPRWHTAWILAFLLAQFLFALVVLALNGHYWAKYGGIVHSEIVQSGFASEPPFQQNVKQVTEPLNMYIFGISSATLALVLIQTLAYFNSHLHPVFTIFVNIALFLAWSGCLAVYFVWGGGLEYTGAAWLSRYNSFCNLHEPQVVSSVEYIYTVTCGGEKILLIMLPFICLNILICPLFTIYALVSLILSHNQKKTRRRLNQQQEALQQPQPQPYTQLSPHQSPPPPPPPPPPQPPTQPYPSTPTPHQPQPFMHQGVLYQPVAVGGGPYVPPPHSPVSAMELSGTGAPMREMAGETVHGSGGGGGAELKA